MNKVSKKLLVIIFVFSACGFATASENDDIKRGSDILKNRIDKKLSMYIDQNMHQGVTQYLEYNAKKHRDSSRYKLILANDKITSKYTILNYKINKQLKFGPNSKMYNIEKQ